jgi:hypothetical protein
MSQGLTTASGTLILDIHGIHIFIGVTVKEVIKIINDYSVMNTKESIVLPTIKGHGIPFTNAQKRIFLKIF